MTGSNQNGELPNAPHPHLQWPAAAIRRVTHINRKPLYSVIGAHHTDIAFRSPSGDTECSHWQWTCLPRVMRPQNPPVAYYLPCYECRPQAAPPTHRPLRRVEFMWLVIFQRCCGVRTLARVDLALTADAARER